jgi:hypothetical protein
MTDLTCYTSTRAPINFVTREGLFFLEHGTRVPCSNFCNEISATTRVSLDGCKTWLICSRLIGQTEATPVLSRYFHIDEFRDNTFLFWKTSFQIFNSWFLPSIMCTLDLMAIHVIGQSDLYSSNTRDVRLGRNSVLSTYPIPMENFYALGRTCSPRSCDKMYHRMAIRLNIEKKLSFLETRKCQTIAMF